MEEQKDRLKMKEFEKRLHEIERRERELVVYYREKRESLYENIDLIIDGMESLETKELMSLLKKMKYEL